MKSDKDNGYIEMMHLIRQRETLCDEWIKKVESWIKEGSLSPEEGLEQLDKIKKEQDITRQYQTML